MVDDEFIITDKACFTCGLTKAITSFPLDARTSDGRSNDCGLCKGKALEKANPTAIAPPDPIPVRGVGAPKKEDKYAEIYRATRDDLHAILTYVPEALMELVKGVWVEQEDKWGRKKVYKKEPNIEAIKVILNRTFGKETQTLKVEGQVDHVQYDMGAFTKAEKKKMLELALADLEKEPE